MKRAPIPTAAEIMQKKLVTVRSDEGIEDAVRRLIKKGYSGAPVVDPDGSLVGVLSEHPRDGAGDRRVLAGRDGGPADDP